MNRATGFANVPATLRGTVDGGLGGDAPKPETIPPEPPPPNPDEMMNQADIVAFLAAHCVEPLGEWRSGEALLYVVEDPYRTDTAHFGDLPQRLRPSVARLDDPDSVEASECAVDKDGKWTRLFRIVNETGGQVDYYAIDPDTHFIRFVKSSTSVRDKDYPYVAPGTMLFRAKDALFPKSQEPAAEGPSSLPFQSTCG